jgi:hypothetical protein
VPRAWGSSVLVVLAAIAAVGCAPALPPLMPGGATPRPTTAAPVQLERAASTATAPVSLDGPIGPTGLFEPTAWPRACAVLDDTGLRTVLPGAGRIAREPRPGEMTVYGVGRTSAQPVRDRGRAPRVRPGDPPQPRLLNDAVACEPGLGRSSVQLPVKLRLSNDLPAKMFP